MNSTYLVKYNYWSSLYKKEKWGMKEKLPFMRINLTASVQINLCRALAVYKNSTLSKWWSIEIFVQKAPKSGLLGKKSGSLFEFCIDGGLIKIGGLFAQIWYVIFFGHKICTYLHAI